jgi:hypothetical protein
VPLREAFQLGLCPLSYPVGGIVVPVDKLGLMAPWMGLVALAAVGGTLLLRGWRRRM